MEHPSNSGYLSMIIGPMFSSKTSKLIQELSTLADLGFATLYINHNSDQRNTEFSDDNITTHSGQFRGISDKISTLKLNSLSELKDYEDYEIIGIDECQFFDDLDTIVHKLVDVDNKYVIITGLDGDINRKPFGKVLSLIPFSDSVIKTNAYCKCCRDLNRKLVKAPFTKLLIRRTFNKDDKQFVKVGSSDLYQPVCRDCYLSNIVYS